MARAIFSGTAVTVSCSNLERSRRFYEEALGADPLFTEVGANPWYKLGAMKLTLSPDAQLPMPGQWPPEHAMLQLWIETDDLKVARDRFKAMGVPILEDNEVSLLVQDPDGLLLEIWEPEDLEDYHRAPTEGKIDRDHVKRVLEAGFRQQFPTDTVDISDGYRDNIHVLVVSRQFDEMSEAEKDDMMWTIIREVGLADAERSLISLVMPVSPAEIK